VHESKQIEALPRVRDRNTVVQQQREVRVGRHNSPQRCGDRRAAFADRKREIRQAPPTRLANRQRGDRLVPVEEWSISCCCVPQKWPIERI
jgi:hypothetical protein